MAGAVCRGPLSSMNGCSSAGRGPAEQPVPGVGADRGDHRQMLGRVAKADGAHQPREVRQCVVHGRFAAVVDGDHQKYRGRRQRRENGLRLNRRHSGDLSVATASAGRARARSRAIGPSVNCVVTDSHDGEHVGQRRRPLRIHRRLSVAVSRLRHGGRRLLAAGYTELRETDPWPAEPGRYFTVRAGSLVAWNAAGPRRRLPDCRCAHRQSQPAGQAASGPGGGRLAGGGAGALWGSLAQLLAGPRSGDQRQAVGA